MCRFNTLSESPLYEKQTLFFYYIVKCCYLNLSYLRHRPDLCRLWVWPTGKSNFVNFLFPLYRLNKSNVFLLRIMRWWGRWKQSALMARVKTNEILKCISHSQMRSALPGAANKNNNNTKIYGETILINSTTENIVKQFYCHRALTQCSKYWSYFPCNINISHTSYHTG